MNSTALSLTVHLNIYTWCFSANNVSHVSSIEQVAAAAAALSRNKNDFREPQIFQALTLMGFSTTGFRQILREMTLARQALLCLEPLSHETLFLDFMPPVSGHWAVCWWQLPSHRQPSGGWAVHLGGRLEQRRAFRSHMWSLPQL